MHPLIYSHPETGKPVLCFHLVSTLPQIFSGLRPWSSLVEEMNKKIGPGIKFMAVHKTAKNCLKISKLISLLGLKVMKALIGLSGKMLRL